MGTYNDKLMVKYHRSITSTHISKRVLRGRKDCFFFQDTSYVHISPSDSFLACSKMAIDKADRRIPYNESCDDSTLRTIKSNNYQRMIETGLFTLFLYLPP